MIDSRRGAKRRVGYFTSYPTRREWNNCFIKNKPLDIWVKMIFQTSTSAKVVIFQNLHSSGFGGLFDVATTTHVEIFAPFKQAWSTTPAKLRRFCLVFLFGFRNEIEAFASWIYWIPDLQLLKVVCFPLVNTGSEKLLHRFKSLTKWRCLQVNGETFLSYRRVKILQLRVEFYQSVVDLLNLPPDGLPTDFKLG